jgi:hypothetical protein
MLVDGGDGENSVLADIRMSVLQARSRRGQERLDEFRFAEFAEEAQGIASNVFIGVL